jgi:hypothetical protein
MRARHRHFKYKSAEASLALDTRYINGVSDNTSLPTWNDVSGNSRDAIGSGVYRTQDQGGNGVISFDGTKFYLSTFTTGTQYSYYCVFKRNGSNTNAYGNATFVFASGIENNTSNAGRRYQMAYADASPNNIFAENSNTSAETTKTRNDNWNIHSVTAPIGVGIKKYLLNGGDEVTSNVSSLTGVTSGTVRMAIGVTSWNANLINGFPFIGRMGLLATYETSHSASFRRRLEHAAAYSFKISCS